MPEYPRIADKHKYEIGKKFSVRLVDPAVGKDGWEQPVYARRATVIRTSAKVLERNIKLADAARECKGTVGRPAFRECVKAKL